MKKILALIVTALLMSALLIPAVYAADLQTGEAMFGTPTVDGKIDDVWSTATTYAIDRFKDGTETSITAQFRALWDESNLYVLIEVNDADHSFNGGPSVGDGVEIYLDIANTKDVAYADDYSAYFALCADDAEYLTFDGSSVGSVYLQDNEVVAITTTDSGYTYEMSISIADFAEQKLAEGMTIGFDIQVNDQNEDSGSRTGAYGWNDDTNSAWQAPSAFGDLTMVKAAEAVVETPVEEVVEETPVEEVVEETPAVEETPVVTETPVTTAPATFDVAVITVIALAASAGVALVSKKH